MLGRGCRKFLNDELGGGTVMGLLWFILLVGITGVAVDILNHYRLTPVGLPPCCSIY